MPWREKRLTGSRSFPVRRQAWCVICPLWRDGRLRGLPLPPAAMLQIDLLPQFAAPPPGFPSRGNRPPPTTLIRRRLDRSSAPTMRNTLPSSNSIVVPYSRSGTKKKAGSSRTESNTGSWRWQSGSKNWPTPNTKRTRRQATASSSASARWAAPDAALPTEKPTDHTNALGEAIH